MQRDAGFSGRSEDKVFGGVLVTESRKTGVESPRQWRAACRPDINPNSDCNVGRGADWLTSPGILAMDILSISALLRLPNDGDDANGSAF